METVCRVCMHHCSLEPGQRGICGARKNEGGEIVCGNYGQVTAFALDPIEKKPLKMFRPGMVILSAGSYGCNLRCPFCQNYKISIDFAAEQIYGGGLGDNRKKTDSREAVESVWIPPDYLAEKAYKLKEIGNVGVAFTYNEPLVGWEYVRDTAKLVKEYGMENVLVTNGTASLEVLEEILPFIDAMNIDLKGFREEYYHKLGGDLETVKAFIIRASRECHVELTTLIVPGENDSLEEMKEEAGWIRSLGKEIPLHITRFFPQYHMTDREATNVDKLYQLAEAAGQYLEYVFVGNC